MLKLKLEQLLHTLKHDDLKPALFVVSPVIVETGGFPGQSKQKWFFSTLSLANSIPCQARSQGGSLGAEEPPFLNRRSISLLKRSLKKP